MVKRKICVVTATRAEYGLLQPLMAALAASRDFELQLVVTGTHLAPEFGLTWKAIAADGFTIDEKVEILLAADTPGGTAKTMGLVLLGFADVFPRLAPDMLVILGDRYELVCVAAAATVFQIPIAHLHGGEITEGAFDDAFRHAITKMSHLHFTSTEEYRKRVIQLGEAPERVFNVGAIGLDVIRSLKLLDRAALGDVLGIDLSVPYFLVTHHPQTVGGGDPAAEIDILCQALLDQPGTQALITKANADPGGRAINARLDEWAARYPERLHLVASLGQLRYLSAMRHSIGVVGNSSSGIIEAPSFGVGTLNIGDRQRGRISAASVHHVPAQYEPIAGGLRAMTTGNTERPKVANPFGDGHALPRIMEVLQGAAFSKLCSKSFHNL